MKKMLEKHGKVGLIGCGLSLLGIILMIVSVFLESGEAKMDPKMIVAVLGFLSFLIGGLMAAFKAEEHRTFKLLGVIFLTGFIATWVFPYGQFSGIDFYNYEMNRVGFSDIPTTIYYAIYFSIDKIVYLFLVAGFYGVLTKVPGYQKLVQSLAKKLKKHEIITAVIISFIIVALTAFFSQTFAMLLIVPFFVSILMSMKIDKLTTFAITFGSILIGILGAIYGTDSLGYFNQYLNQEVTVALTYRVIIAFVAFFLYNFFICMRLKKVLKEKPSNEEIEDIAFVTEPTKAKTSIIPISIVLGLLLVIIVLGFVDWNAYFGITVFDDFHKWLTELTIGEDFTVFASLLGSNATAFGKFDLLGISIIITIFGSLIAFLYRVKLADYLEAFYNGMKKMFKPALYFIMIYAIFAICYLSPFMATFSNWAFNLVDGLNPFIASIVAFITSIFQADLGYTAYNVGGFLTAAYAENFTVVHAIYTSMYGLVQVLMPTGCILLIGLGLMKVDYKSWFKYIWLFVVGMLIILLVLFTVLTYI
ncbi:MAG: hypothetical protein K2M17_02200 [Bacilli bacterium]|nr:hypothetical protein [Bacilli bacterium]